MQIIISGIPIDVQKKNIKNMHLYVKPPDGHVIISAPQTMDDKAIEIYARTNLSWIKKQIQQYQNQPRSSKRQYVSGETIYVWGKPFFIQFIYCFPNTIPSYSARYICRCVASAILISPSPLVSANTSCSSLKTASSARWR